MSIYTTVITEMIDNFEFLCENKIIYMYNYSTVTMLLSCWYVIPC